MTPRHILILDDHALYREALEQTLKLLDFPVTVSAFAEPGMALDHVDSCMAEGRRIDLIITDQIHRGIDGAAFAGSCREKLESAGYPATIVLLSMTAPDHFTYAPEPDKSLSRDNPFNLKLPKSVATSVLLEKISGLLCP